MVNIFRKSYRWFMWKFFKRERRERPEEVTAAFLRSCSKLAEKGKVNIYRGGQRTFASSLMDKDKLTYILTIDVKRTQVRVEDREWFNFYVEKERGVL